MAGTITSNEGHGSVSSANLKSHPQINGAQHDEILPVTKVPALDTIDPYTVRRDINIVVVNSPRTELICSTDILDVVDDIIQGYARFISEFVGLEDIAFLVSRHEDFGSGSTPARNVIVAYVFSSKERQSLNCLSSCAVRQLDERYYNKDEIQFSLDLGSNSEPENGEKQHPSAQEHHFNLFIRPTAANRSILEIGFSCPRQLIPDPAVHQLLKTIASHIASSSKFLTSKTALPEASIINFPPLMTPPPIDDRHNGGVGYSNSQRSLLHAAFEGWARRKPNAIALDFVHSLPSVSASEHSILTYAALDKAASNVAIHIRALVSGNEKPADYGRIIPVYMTTSPELYISYLGILKAGYAFSPIPQDAPAQRVQEIIEDIGSPIILGNAPEPFPCPWQVDCANKITKYTWVDVAEVSKWKELRGDQIPPRPFNNPLEKLDIQENQIAYLLFTSGSTGKPKGVQVSHLAVTCSINSHATSIPLPGDSLGDFRWFQFASPTFDPSLMEIFVTLSCGATLCSADRGLTLMDLEATINETKATVMMATPSLAALLRPSRLTTLQSLWTMGEKLNRTVIENFAAKPDINGTKSIAAGPSRMLVNAYGPTEGAINCTFLPFDYSIRGSIIGKELPTCAMFVLEPNSKVPKIVPSGLTGELAIGGPQISKGYLNRPKETAKSFVFSPEFGYLYRTGDMGRIVWDESGSQVLEFLGRITSDQVKISGRRLELSEVESVLATVDRVTEVVAVVSKQDNNLQGSEQIVACLVTSDKSDIAKQEIMHEAQRTAQRHLSSYMCPSAYTFFPSLPKSSSGKVDRKSISAKLQLYENNGLQVFSSSTSGLSNSVQVDWDATDDADLLLLQQLVVTLISETIEEDACEVKAGADLHSLGIDSLGAMRLLQKLRDHSIGGLSVADVLQSGTPKALVSTIARYRQANCDASTNGIDSDNLGETIRQNLASFSDRNRLICAERLYLTPEKIQNVLPTTATQSGMLASFLRSSADNTFASRSYIYHSVLPLEPHVDIERLKIAWQSVTACYDSFRTVFCWLDDDMAPFAQCILAEGAVAEANWNVYSVSPDDTLGEEGTLTKALRNADETISLDTPPWRLSLVQSAERTLVVLSMFHGIFDGGSLQLLLEDVSSVYAGMQVAKRTSLEYIVKHHFNADHNATSRFWEKQLEQYSPAVFPSLTPYRPPSAKTTQRVEIIAQTSHISLKRRSRNIGSTPLAVLQAAWGSVLLAYTGTPDQDIVMGSVVSGRLDPDSEICIGPTFTTVPIRMAINHIQKDPRGLYTNRVVARHLTSLNTQSLPYLQPRLGSLVTADGRLPYDTLLAYQDFNAGSSSSGLWSLIDHPPMANDFAVMIEIWPDVDSSLTFRASFNNTQLDSRSAEDMLRSMADIVEYILGDPNGDFLDAPSNIQPELKSVYNRRASVVQEVSENALLHSRFENHAESHPNDLALIFKGDLENDNSSLNTSWTYSELNSIADDLAEHLQMCGLLANTPVPICIDKSPALYVAILGILKAGGAWCPIDTLAPAQRRHDLIARTGSNVLLVSSVDGAQPDDAVPSGVGVVDVSKFRASTKINGVMKKSMKKRTNSEGMAYLIWTSGTTGAPKGVPISHSAAVCSINSLCRDIPANADGSTVRCLQFSQYTFDVSIQDIFYTWGLGGVLISASREIMLGSFSKLANLTKATHAHLTPAFAAGVPRNSCKTLKVVTMIGEKLTHPVAEDWGTDMRAFNTYGPAEVTIVSTIREFGNEHNNIKSANIGWPMDTVSVYVTKNQRTVMKNAVGELALGGPQLSPGYLNQKDVTKAKFLWSEEAFQTLYYTGDLVRMLADGSLEYINRVDDLVKLGGIRVELSEISFSLRGCHPQAENIETLILSRPDRPSKVVVVFLSASGADGPADDGQLLILNDKALEIARSANDQAQAILPDYMIPSVYLVVRSIPRTPSAKTDRRALQAAYAVVDIEAWESRMNPENIALDQISVDQSSTSTTANIISKIALLANVSPSIITKTSRLGSLGIDSIRAIRLASRLKESGYQLSVVEVLNCVTVQDLVKLASSVEVTRADTDAFDLKGFNDIWHTPVSAKVREDFLAVPATTIQESLLSETMGTYNMYWSNHFFSLDRSVDINKLRHAWLSVSQNTEALRTGFVPVAEVTTDNKLGSSEFSMLQLIYRLPDFDWGYCECSEQDWIEQRDNRIDEIMKKHQNTYFKNPPWAVTVFDKKDEMVMVFTIHHSIHDGPSLSLVMDDVLSAYSYKPPSRHQLSDALSILLPTNERCKDTYSFWSSELEKFSELDVPVWPDLTGIRLQQGEVQEHRFIAAECPLTEPASELQTAIAQLGVSSIVSIIRAAWGFVSISYLGVPATVFGETLSDRVLHPDLEDNIGPLVSVVPIPFHPEGSVREFLAEQHRLSIQSWKYRHIHARDVRKMLKRPRGEPLYPAVFNFHVADEEPKSSPSHIWHELEDQIGLHVEHPMAMNVFQRANGSLVLEASSDIALMNKDQLALFVNQIDGLVSAMLRFPDEQVSNLVTRLPTNLRSISNRPVSDIVADSVNTSPTYWLELYAKEHPEWTAVEVANSISPSGIEKEIMTYGMLNTEANRVAAFIASLGHKNRMIAVCCGRNIPSYPVIIGIFKSGNIYLPIDEGLPADRKAFLIEDADCPLLFTESSFSPSFSRVPETCHMFCTDDLEFQRAVMEMPPENRDYQSHPDDLSYLLFTSGSTGKPKGVMVTRGNLSSFIESYNNFIVEAAPRTLKLGGTGRQLAQASRAFDPHLLEMFYPWRHGMATATAPRAMILDDLQVTLSQWEITHACFVPSLVDQANILPEHCPNLVYMSVGGEKISQKVLDAWATSHITLANAYGPTEVTIGCTFAHIDRDTNMRNIGPPLTSCVCHVLVPGTQTYTLKGQTGELCFTGDIVAKGYLNRPDATGFVSGPNGERMYRTGDIGRLMADDSVEYLGRGDDQTKIRGQRLELGEVSEILRSSSAVEIDVVTTVAKHPGLARVQLISFFARSDARQREKGGVVAFIQSDFTTLGKELQDICKKKLPGYMIPELILPITYIPLAPMSGKANVKDLHALFSSLPLPAILQGNNSTNIDGASMTRLLTADEGAVVNEVCTVIAADPSTIGPLTNIFEVGLDSLSAIGLSIKLRKIGYEATVALVMSNPVIEQLARLPRKSSSQDANAAVSKIRQSLVEKESLYHQTIPAGTDVSQVASVMPCLPLQEGLVARSINNEGDQLYVNHVVLQLEDHIDGAQLKSAWQAVASDNAIMRTAFAPLDKEVVQVILSADSHTIRWDEESYGCLEESLEKQKLRQGQVSRDIISNISTVPPVRFQFACSSSNRPLALFVSIHHALYDGESFSMLLDDVAARYAKDPVPQRGSPATFIEHIYTQDSEKAKRYWTQYLSGCRSTLFRTDFNVLESPRLVSRTLSNKLTDLERRSASLQTTVPSLVQAIFALLLADAVGVSDVTYGLVLSGRAVSVTGADSVILPCITTVPGRLDTNELNTVTEVVEYVQKSTVRSLEFQHTSLRHIQRWLNSDSPLFDCLFSYIQATTPSNHNIWRELDSQMPAEYPLAVEVEASSTMDTVNINCYFSPVFSSLHGGEEFLEKMEAVLSSVVSGETLSLDNFNLPQSEGSGSRSPIAQWDETTWSVTEAKIRDLTGAFCGLALTDVSKGASFISLGIDSVTAIRFSRTLREVGFAVSSSDVMRFSCVGALAMHIEQISIGPQNQSNGHKSSAVPYDVYKKHVHLLSESDSISAAFECTPLQSGMITQTIGSAGQVYVHPHPVRLAESVDVTQLKTAVHKVILSNDILRTSFHLIPELAHSWIGAVHTYPPFEWKEISLPSDADVLSEVSAIASFREEASFEVPPIRTVLVNQPDGRLLVIIMHHALYDGASLPFFFEDLAIAYDNKILAERPQFSETVEYVLAKQADSCDFWTQKLLGYKAAEIPQLPSDQASDRMFLSEHRVDLELSTTIESCKAMEVTVQSVALLAYAKVLAHTIGQRDVVFGQVLAGRSLPTPGAEKTLGPLFNTVAQRVTFEPRFLSNKAMALQLQLLTADAQVYQQAPLRVIQNSLRQVNEFKSTSLFDTLFVFQKSADFAGGILETQQIWTPYETDDYAAQAEYKLNVEVDHGKDGIVARASCNGQYLSQSSLDNFIAEFGAVFRDIIEHPTRCATVMPERLGELPLSLSAPEQQVDAFEDSDAPAHENMIQSVLADVTGVTVDHIKPRTSIFSIGLDSLSAIRIASICRSKGLKTSVADILQGNTLRGISQRVRPIEESTIKHKGSLFPDYERIEKAVSEKLSLPKEAIEAILPCLGGQFYHLISWLRSGRKLFEPAWPYFSSECIDSEKLEEAWYQLRQRHPILRTCFAALSSSEAVQVIMKEALRDTETFQVISSSSPITDAAKAQAKEEALKPSSLFVPPVRLRLLKASDRDGILILVNHAAYDAWTMPMFVTELERLYRGQLLDTNPDFASFVDFSVRSLRDIDEKAYWAAALRFGNCTVIKNSMGSRDSTVPDQLFVGAWEKVKNVSQLETTCRSVGLSLQTLVLLAVARCLARMTGVKNPTMGLYQAGRSGSFAGIEKLTGPCLNVNPFTVPDAISDIDNSPSKLLSKAQAIQASLAERVSYEQSSLWDVLRWAGAQQPERPLFNAWVNLLWMQNAVPSSNDITSDVDSRDSHNLFLPLHVGVPTDFIPVEPPAGLESTSVSALDTSSLPNENLYIDIGPDPKTDTIGFGIRVEGGILSEEEVDQFVTGIANEIDIIVSSLQ